MIAASTAIKWRIIMKLVSFAASGRNSYGAVVGDGVFDLGRRLGDRYPTLRAAIAGDALGAAAAEVKSGAPDIALSQVTLLPPITDPDKIICAGRNYRAHAAEAGGAPPENPSVFLRLVNTLVAHNQPMVCPKISGDFDYGLPGRAAAGSRPHAAGLRFDPLNHDQGHRDCQRHRRAGVPELLADAGRPEFSPDRGVVRRDGGLFHDPVPGDARGRHRLCAARFAWAVMTLDWAIVWENAGALARGAEITVLLAVATMLLAIPGGVLLALMRLSPVRPLALASAGFTEFFRNLPLLLVIYAAYYIMPLTTGISFSPFATALVALALNVSAYNGETFRAGIQSIRKGQSEAALALGMSRAQVMREVVLPQAARRIAPVLASTWVSLFKDTSLVSVIAVGELAYTAMRIRSQSFRVLEMLTAMAAIYWALGYPQAKLVDWLHRKFAVSE